MSIKYWASFSGITNQTHRLKAKTKVITLINYNKRKQSNEPIRTRSKYEIYVTGAKRGKTRAKMVQLVEKVAPDFLAKLLSTQLKTALTKQKPY